MFAEEILLSDWLFGSAYGSYYFARFDDCYDVAGYGCASLEIGYSFYF